MSGLRSSASVGLGDRLVELLLVQQRERLVGGAIGGLRLPDRPREQHRRDQRGERRDDPARVRAPFDAPLVGGGRGAIAALPERAEPREVSGRNERHDRRLLDEPRPVEQRLDAEHERHERQRDQGDAIRVPVAPRRWGGVAAAPQEPPWNEARGAQRGHHPGEEEQRRDREADEPEVGHRLRDPSVCVLGHGRVGAMPEPRLLERSRADSLEWAVVEHSERLAPVLAARRRRGEHAAAALPGRHLRFTGELVDAVTDAALAEGHRREGRERHEARDA